MPTSAPLAPLDGEVALIRARLERRILWLRRLWRHDPLISTAGVITDAEADSWLGGEDRDAEAQFYRRDAQALELSRRIDQLEQDLGQDDASALAALTRQFGLSRHERRLLMLAAAPEFDATLDRLYAYAQDDATRRYATAHLAAALYPDADLTRLAPEAPLLFFSLLQPAHTAEAPSARALRVDERILNFLRGHDRVDARVEAALTAIPPAPVVEPQSALLERLVRVLETGAAGWRLLNLTSHASAGPATFAGALGRQLGVTVYRLDPKRVPSQGREEWLRLVERESVLRQLVIYVDAHQSDQTDWDWLDQFRMFVIVGSRQPVAVRRRAYVAELPEPGALALWQAAAGEVPSLELLAEQYLLEPEAVVRTVDAAKDEARLEGEATVTFPRLWRAARKEAGRQLDALAQRIEPAQSWDDLVLPADTAQHLREIAAQVGARHAVYALWDYGRKLARGRGITALFAGPSGTGKTMAAEVLARALELDLYRIDLASTISKYIGETEKNLRRIFDAAEQGGAILFFDEADALFGKRTEVKDSHDRYANIEVNYLLQRMEDYRGLAILATNRKTALDRAFLRRLRFLVDFPLPDPVSRRQIWQKWFPAAAPLGAVDFDQLSRLEIAGGNIRNIAVNAAFLAAAEKSPIEMRHIESAARREYAKIDQVLRDHERFPGGGRV